MKYTILILIIVLATNLLSAQESNVREIKGKVVSEAPELENIYVINLKTEITSTTEKGGYFRLQAAVGDTLMFSAIQIKGHKIVLTEKDFAKDLVLFPLDPVINRLDEVIVKQYKNINAVSLGIIAMDTKHYTPAERKLRAASGADLKGNEDGTMGASASLDPIFNWMSGRTAMLKKELEVEKKETLLEKLENQFALDYFIYKLKIPKEYVKGFWYYAVEESRLATALNTKNKAMASFVLAELSTNYLELQKCGNK
jgi:hypothetical protein